MQVDASLTRADTHRPERFLTVVDETLARFVLLCLVIRISMHRAAVLACLTKAAYV